MNAARNGWTAERWVKAKLAVDGPPDRRVIDLAPAFSCDLLVLDVYGRRDIVGPCYRIRWVEVKSGRRPARARGAKLKPAELAWAVNAERQGDLYEVWRVRTRSDRGCELLSVSPR